MMEVPGEKGNRLYSQTNLIRFWSAYMADMGRKIDLQIFCSFSLIFVLSHTVDILHVFVLKLVKICSIFIYSSYFELRSTIGFLNGLYCM